MPDRLESGAGGAEVASRSAIPPHLAPDLAPLALGVVSLAVPTAALAQSMTIGEAVHRGFFQARLLDGVIVGGFFLLAVVLVGSGLLALARAAGERGRVGFADGGLRVLVGAVLASLPVALGIGAGTLWGRTSFPFLGATAPGVGAPRNCLLPDAGGFACVADNLARNVAPIVVFAAVGLALLAGLLMIGRALHDLALSRAERAPAPPQGLGMRIAIGVLLANMPLLTMSLLETMGAPLGFGPTTDGHISAPETTYIPETDSPFAARVNALLRSVFTLLAMFGVLAIIRGLFLLRRAAEARGGRGETAAAITHVIAGALMTNMDWTVCTVARTFLGHGGFLTFCPL